MSRHNFNNIQSDERTIHFLYKVGWILALIALALIAINLTSCTKAVDLPDEVYYNPSEDYEEINDIEDDSDISDPLSIEERGVTFRIYSVEPTGGLYDKVVGNECTRFGTYTKLDILAGNQFTIKGKGFGNIKDSINIVASYKTGINFPVIKNTVIDTMMVVSIAKFTSLVQPVLKNLNLKFTCTRDFNGVTKKAVKSIKGTSYWKNQHLYTQLPSTLQALYPNSVWEVMFQQQERGTILNKYYASPTLLSTNYTPEIGDLLLRDEVAGQYGIVKEVSSPDAAGKRKLKVWERNYKCKGAIQKKTYYLKAGQFLENRYGEPSFDYFLKEVAN